MNSKKLDTKIDNAADKAKALSAKASAKLEEVGADIRTAAKKGEHRLGERVEKVGHALEEMAVKAVHSVKETAQEVIHETKEALTNAANRLDEKKGNPS